MAAVPFHLILIVSMLLFVPGNPSLYAAEIDLSALYGLGQLDYHRHEARAIEQTYHLVIRAPETTADTTYPTLYLLDGGVSFPVISGMYHYHRVTDEVPELIIVGISYGTSDWRAGNMRSRDFTAPAADRDFWGGAADFQTVLQTEIIPYVEANYPTDPGRRILFGQSLGGQFVLYTALTQPTLFWGHLASNPALHRNLDFFLARADSAIQNPPARLFVGSGSHDDPRFREPLQIWHKKWTTLAPANTYHWQTLDGHTHMSAAPETFRHGIRWLFRPMDSLHKTKEDK